MLEAIEKLLNRLTPYEELDSNVDNSRLLVVSNDHKIESLERFQAAPNRIKRKPQLASCKSFCEYVNRFKTEGTSVYLNKKGGQFVAAIDHHGPESPSWQDHIAEFAPAPSLQWQAWSGINRRPLSQTSFAEFIEDHLDDIETPAANEVLKSALDFQDTKNVTVASAQNLDNGAIRFHFTKENGSADVTFPHRIWLSIPIIENEDHRHIEARIRYKVSSEGILTFTMGFVKGVDVLMNEELETITTQIQEQVDGPHFYAGVR